MKPIINKSKCIGCGACAAVCPKVFELKEGKSSVKAKETDAPCAKEAADICPVRAISIK